MTEEQIQTLLRERAHVQPPEGYARELLERLHQRQRAELLHRSVWRIALDRYGAFLSEHSMSTPTYALSLAALVAVGMALIFALRSGPPAPGESVASRRAVPAAVEGVGGAGSRGVQPLSNPPVDAQTVSFGGGTP